MKKQTATLHMIVILSALVIFHVLTLVGIIFVSINMMTSEKQDALLEIRLMANDRYLKPYIDRKFTLDEIVKAHAYVDSGRKRGNVVIILG